MSSLMRWNPRNRLLAMNDAFDRLFDDAFMMPREWGLDQPKVDVKENNGNLVVTAELPGFDPNSIDVRCEGNMLTIRGEKTQENEKNEDKYYMRERTQRSFTRTIPLPSEIDADKAQAEFENGVLTLTLPTREVSKSKQTNISAKSNDGNQSSQQNNHNNQQAKVG